jgi:hypothetical protein
MSLVGPKGWGWYLWVLFIVRFYESKNPTHGGFLRPNKAVGTLTRLEILGSEGVSTQRKTADQLNGKGMASEMIGGGFDRSCTGNAIDLPDFLKTAGIL